MGLSYDSVLGFHVVESRLTSTSLMAHRFGLEKWAPSVSAKLTFIYLSQLDQQFCVGIYKSKCLLVLLVLPPLLKALRS